MEGMVSTMIYTDSKQLVKEYKKVLIEEGSNIQRIADEFGVSRQSLYAFLKKKRMSFDDMVKLLTPLGYEIEYRFVKKGE